MRGHAIEERLQCRQAPGPQGDDEAEVTGFGVRFTLEALLRQGLLDGLERPK